MVISRPCQTFLAMLVCLSGFAFSQQQWLGYKTSESSYSYIGSTSGQNMTLTDKAPQGVKLPEFKEDKPLFFTFKTPISEKPVQFMLARSDKNSVYNRLYVDSNFDNSWADETPAKPQYSSNRKDYKAANFNGIKLVLPTNNGPVTYHLRVHYRGDRKNGRVYLDPCCWYEGLVNIGGKQYWCVLIDENANAKFGEISPAKNKCDKIRIDENDKKFIPRSQSDHTRYLGKYVEVAGKMYSVDIAPDGAYIEFKPAENIVSGKITCDNSISAINVHGQNGNFVRKFDKGQAELPVGKYTLNDFTTKLKDDSDAVWMAKGNYYNKKTAIDIKPGKPTILKIKQPFICKVNARKRGSEYYLNLSLMSSDGATLSFTRNGKRPPAPKLNIKNADGSYNHTFRMRYG